MIVTFTDFGLQGPYLGQMAAVIHRTAPGQSLVNLFADVPCFDIEAASCLLAAYEVDFPEPCYFLCVVDPGVGSDRRGVILRRGGKWFVGPDNGLFARLAGDDRQYWEITYRPESLSSSFHGRDIFAPVTAGLAAGQDVAAFARPLEEPPVSDGFDDLHRIIYIDHFGNAMTGIRADNSHPHWRLKAGGHCLSSANTFSDRRVGSGFWYRNANGLVEIAVNRGSAALALGLAVGQSVEWLANADD